MELRIFIIIGILIQSFISRASRKTGAIFGYVITTFILIYGLNTYSNGGYIAFFGIELSTGGFFIMCLIWYGFDTFGMVRASKLSHKINEELVNSDKVANFYKSSMKSWSEGVMDDLNKAYKNEGKKNYNDFIKNYAPYKGGIFEQFFLNFPSLDNEYLIGMGEKPTGDDRAWFILTNLRLILKDGLSKTFSQISLSEIEDFNFNKAASKLCVFKLKSGETMEMKNVEMYPSEKYMKFAISLAN